MTAISQSFPRWFGKRKPNRSPYKLGWGKASLLALPMVFLTALMTFGQIMQPGSTPDPLVLLATALTWLLFNSIFFAMVKTGQTDRYRAFLFVSMAVAFIVFFMAEIIEKRGSLALTGANMIEGETPFCHLVIPMIILPAAVTRTVIFPGSLMEGFASVAGMIVLWTGASLVLGRAWCSWGCFYGGIDEGFSRLLKKPRITKIDRRWTLLPWAVLLGVVLVSAVTLSPAYCEWLCPFKAVTEFEAITSIKVVIQTIIFVSLFISTVVVLPILTKRRTQCGLFCPMGALQGATNKINIYDVRIDPAKCTQCGHCEKNCPTFSIDESSYTSGTPLMSCTKCGKCVDVCPNHAISYHIKGTQPGARPLIARMLFLYPAFLFLATFGGGMFISAIWRILRLLTTGSMI
ncbi:MAG: 4Fe-4S binding protein [Chloroflexota bacterium]